MLVSDETVGDVGISGSCTGNNFAFNSGAESIAILTHDGNEPPIRYLCFESPCKVQGYAPLKATIVVAFSSRSSSAICCILIGIEYK